MRKTICAALALALATAAAAQTLTQLESNVPVISLDSCEKLALLNNKDQKIADAEVQQAEYEHKAARGMYFPSISIKGAYFRNQKNISLLGSDAMLPIGAVMADGSFGFHTPTVTGMDANGMPIIASDQLSNKWTMITGADGKPQAVPLDADGMPFDPKANPEKLQWKEYTTIPKEQMEGDIKNMFIGVLNLTQPIYMGGKIAALNKVTGLKKELAQSKRSTNQEDVIASVDEAYWRIVSLYAKKKAVQGLIDLLDTMSNQVDEMINAGVATKKDALTVAVKKNEAQMTMVRVDNGISLYKMQLAQYCGLPIDQPYDLADQNADEIEVAPKAKPDIETVYDNRSEIKSLELAKALYDQKVTIARADMLPPVALTGNYLASNPNLYNGIENKFGFMWNVGVVVNIPLFHFGADYYKMKAAQSEALVQELKLGDTKEKINLQINQSSYKQTEAFRKLEVATKNLEQADENLRMAQLSFEAGMIGTSSLLEAQTAWLGATSDKIDAQIEAKINGIYLDRYSGNLKRNE